MADHERVRPVRQCRHLGAEQRGAGDDRIGRLLDRRPPDFLDRARNHDRGHAARQFGARRADVAGEGVALAHDRVDVGPARSSAAAIGAAVCSARV